MNYADYITIDGTRYDLRDNEAVSYAQSQSLTDEQKEQARENIDAASSGDIEAVQKDISKLRDDNNTTNENLDTLKEYVRGMSPLATVGPSSIATVDDAAPLDAEDLAVAIAPVQDLHGYDRPWPGGGGKNLFDQKNWMSAATSKTSIIWNEDAATVTTTNATYGGTKSPLIALKAGTTYTLSGHVKVITLASKLDPRLALRNSGNSIIASSTMPAGESEADLSVSYTPSEDVELYVSYLITGSTAESAQAEVSKTQLEIGSNATEFEPYSNICPISGWTGASIHVSPTTDAQDGSTYTVTWTSDAGTVYGGTLDATTGLLTATHGYFEIDGETSGKMATFAGSYNLDDTRVNCIFGFGSNGQDGICAYGKDELPDYRCNAMGPMTYNGAYSTDADKAGYGIYPSINATGSSNRIRLAIPKSLGVITVDDANAWVRSIGGLQVSYPLITPVTYQLTPLQVKMLQGGNNIWADCGDAMLAYRRDISILIDKLISNESGD